MKKNSTFDINLQEKLVEAKNKFVETVKKINMNVNTIIPEGGAHFFESTAKLEDLKKQLDSDLDKDKMDAMKRLIAMTSKGKDVSSLFPSVVKNVVSKNIELKKLVYMYLVHYAELEPDSALLAINSFQKDLGNANQFIRSSALRVMSSIRVEIIVQLIVLAIQKGVKDTSPYVRKTAALAISKVYSLDPEKKDELIEIIKILLADKSTMVIGSAIAAFSEVCPDRLELLHPHYRRICYLLADIDEWGQIIIMNTFLRYCRTQFEDPNKPKAPKEPKAKKEKKRTESDGSGSESEADDDVFGTDMDADLKLLLDSTLPLLKSRNAGVILAVGSLYYYLATSSDIQKVGKALVRILKSGREIEWIALVNIATMAATRKTMFEQFVSEFFISPSDPSFCRKLKLEILTYIVNQDNINKILKEFKTYVNTDDKEFAAATIQAIGRCASSVPEVTDRCLHGLMGLLSSKSDTVVAESVVVIKKLLQMVSESDDEHGVNTKDIISHLAKLLETITSPKARASILWVIGEYSHKVPLLGPDILRKLAKSFLNEDPMVKLQILNLGSKLYLTNSEQTKLLFDYVLNLTRYDANYDVRDKSRLMKKLILSNTTGKLSESAQKLFITKKPIPTEISSSADRQRFTLGSLSHMLNHTVTGYQPISDFPEVAPDKSVRNEPIIDAGKLTKGTEKEFWDEKEESEESGGEEYSGSGSEYSGSEGSRSGSGSGSRSGSDYSEEEAFSEEGSEEEIEPKTSKTIASKKVPEKTPEKKKTQPVAPPASKEKSKKPAPPKKDSLDDLFNFSPAPTSPSTPSKSNSSASPKTPAKNSSSLSIDDLFGSPNTSNGMANNSPFLGSDTVKYVMLKHVVGGGLSIEYAYQRAPSMFGATVNTLVLWFTNHLTKPISNIRIGKLLNEGIQLIPFPEIAVLAPGTSTESNMHIQFTGVSTPVKFELATDNGSYTITLTPNVGDLVRATSLSATEFADNEKKLKGMHELSEVVTLKEPDSEITQITQRVSTCAYLSPVTVDYDAGKFTFAGKTNIDDKILLFCADVDKSTGKVKCTINSENTVLNAMLLKQLKKAILGEQEQDRN